MNAISPGYIETRFSPGERGPKYEEQHRRNLANIPLGRGGKPEDIGRAAVFLCSDESHYTTGAILRVDGGLTVVPNY